MTQELRKLAKRLREGQTHDFTTGYLLDQSAVMDESADAIDALLDRLEAAEKDAERYRWLRDTGSNGFSDGVPQRGLTVATEGSVKLHFAYWMTAEQFDKTIDAAMEASK